MKIAILMGILVELLSRQTTAKQLAEKFELSQRSVYRYIEVLCQSGVPVVSIQGKHGGLFVNKNFCINNLFLTENEFNELISTCQNKALKQKLEFAKNANKKEP